MAGSAKTVEGAFAAIDALAAELGNVITDLETIRTKYEAHTHDGVTAGGAASGVRTAGFALAAAGLVASTVTLRYQV